MISRRLRRLSRDCNRLLVLGSVLGQSLESTSSRTWPRFRGGTSRRSRRGNLRTRHPRGRDQPAEAAIRAHPDPRHALRRRDAGASCAVSSPRGRRARGAAGRRTGAALAELASHALAASEFEKGLEYARRAAAELSAFSRTKRRRVSTRWPSRQRISRSVKTRRSTVSSSFRSARRRVAPEIASQPEPAFVEASELARRLGLSHLLGAQPLGMGEESFGLAPVRTPVSPYARGSTCCAWRRGLGPTGAASGSTVGRCASRRPLRARRDTLSRDAIETARRLGRPTRWRTRWPGVCPAIVAPDAVDGGTLRDRRGSSAASQ